MNFRIISAFLISIYFAHASELIAAGIPRSVVLPSPGIVPGVPGIVPGVPGPFYANLAPRYSPAIAPVPAVPAVAPAPFAPVAGPAIVTGYAASPLGYQFPFGLQARSIHAVAPVAIPAAVPALHPAPLPVAVTR